MDVETRASRRIKIGPVILGPISKARMKTDKLRRYHSYFRVYISNLIHLKVKAFVLVCIRDVELSC